jgi:hypothetical protein
VALPKLSRASFHTFSTQKLFAPPLNIVATFPQLLGLPNPREDGQIRHVIEISKSKFIPTDVLLFSKDLIVGFEYINELRAIFFNILFVGDVIGISVSS